jgi:hypothetical protein
MQSSFIIPESGLCRKWQVRTYQKSHHRPQVQVRSMEETSSVSASQNLKSPDLVMVRVLTVQSAQGSLTMPLQPSFFIASINKPRWFEPILAYRIRPYPRSSVNNGVACQKPPKMNGKRLRKYVKASPTKFFVLIASCSIGRKGSPCATIPRLSLPTSTQRSLQQSIFWLRSTQWRSSRRSRQLQEVRRKDHESSYYTLQPVPDDPSGFDRAHPSCIAVDGIPATERQTSIWRSTLASRTASIRSARSSQS